MFRSATVRLTLYYLAIVMAISILFSVALYNVTSSELSQGLNSESQRIINLYPIFQHDRNITGPQSYYDTSSHRLILRLVIFNIIVLISAGILSYLLARHTLEPIEAAHEQQKRFTSDVSHELRTPLTAIRMESEVALLNKNVPTKELRETISSNLEEVGKLEDLINNLLRLSRLEAYEIQQNFTELNSKDIMEHAVEKVSKIADMHGINIKQSGNGGVFSGDDENLTQLLTILLDNAIKYSPKGSEVDINTHDTKEQIVWRITDKGSGIEPDSLSHIFDRFYRSDSSRNKTKPGFGLGLSIAKMIADVHNGTITISSKVNHGTSATVTLPKYPA